MVVSLKLSWHDQVSFSDGDGEATITGPGARLSLRNVAPEIMTALRRLAPPGDGEETLAEGILANGTFDTLARWYYHVDQFHRRGLICRCLHMEGRPLATLVPLNHAIPPARHGNPAGAMNPDSTLLHRRSPRLVDNPDLSFSLSRFAYLRNDQGALVLESPLSRWRLVLHDPRAMSVVGALATHSAPAELCERVPTLPSATIIGLIALLEGASMIDATRKNQPTDNSDEQLESWEFHDLLFHSRSRRGRSDAQFGATYRLVHRTPPPALRLIEKARSHDLYRPDLERLERDDPPFAQVQNRRRSVRTYGDEPVTAQQLGEFLFRVGRVTETWTAEIPGGPSPATMEFAGRPYPAGGALYELEMYPLVRACRGLNEGMYRYDPAHHRLQQVAGRIPEVESLIDDAASSAGVDPRTVQVLIVLASRFGRIAWKYESIAYALTLKHVGIVYQTMYLAATAMGLAPCAVGCGDSDLFARAAGTAYHVESSVGEFLLGSRK